MNKQQQSFNNKSLHKQKGLTAFGLIFVIASFGFFIVTSFKVGPMYMDFYQVQTIINAVAKDDAVNLKSPRDIWTAMNKRLRINNIRHLTKDDFKIVRDREKKITTITIDYEVRDEYVANTFIGAKFNKTIELIR